jgi:ribosomal protein S18 acetylase RimI-like enzyme
MPVMIRPLRPDEATSYRAIRLEALRLHPEAFSASFEQEEAESLAFHAARLTGSTVFGAFLDDASDPRGMAGLLIPASPKIAHKCLFWGMYIRPPSRRTGLARQLVEAVIEHARTRAEQIHLSVTASNIPARRLYQSLGFEPYGTEPRALKIDGQYFDDILMVKQLL